MSLPRPHERPWREHLAGGPSCSQPARLSSECFLVEKTEPDVAKQIMSPLLRVGLNLSRSNRLARRCVRAPWCFLAQWYNRLEFVAPCYYVQAVLNERSTIVDCGTGLDANFSQALMARFGVRAIGVDPTRKHRSALTALEHRSNGS